MSQNSSNTGLLRGAVRRGHVMPQPSRRVSRGLSHAKDEKAFQDAVRTGRFTEGELQALEQEFQKVHRRKPRRP